MILAWAENRKTTQNLKENAESQHARARRDCAEVLRSAQDKTALLNEIRRWQDQETNRRELVDNKAATLFGTAGLAAALTTFLGGTVISETCGASSLLYAALGFIAAAILYLAMVLICAAKAQFVRAYYATSAATVDKWLSTQEDIQVEVGAEAFTATKLNEDVIRQKMNWLSAGQQSFINAVVLLFVSAVALLAHIALDC